MYAKIINEETKEVSIGTGTDINYYMRIGMEEMDVEQAYNSRWYIKGYAPAKPEELIKQEQICLYKKQLDEIDLRSIRPSRAIQSGTGTQEDIDKLASLEAQAEERRQKIKALEGE